MQNKQAEQYTQACHNQTIENQRQRKSQRKEKGKYFIYKTAIRTKSEKKKKIESDFSLESRHARESRGI